MLGRRMALALAAAGAFTGAAASYPVSAQENGAPESENLPSVTVFGTTPLPGSGVDIDKVPANVQTLSGSDLAREGTPSLINGLASQASSVNVNATLGDPFQPDLLYRGFAASPVLGTPQGLAVYQNGVRVNEAFGDAVNWDLIPDVAIDRLNVASGNPVYGLNALGGAVLVTMKNGFTYQGFESELAGGSFGQRGTTIQFGKQAGNFAAYVAGRFFDEDGWRQFSPDHVKQIYADAGVHGEKASVDLTFAGANNRLAGEGTVPVQELAVNRSLVFTSPQLNIDELEFVTSSGSYQATDTLSFQADAYRREFHQDVENGNTTNFTACAPPNGLVCQSDATTALTSTSGGTIPDLSNGGTNPIGENDRETIRAVTIGGALQTTYTGEIFGRENNFVAGASLDHANVDFQSSTEPGVINPALQVLPSGFFVSTAENTGFSATPVSLSAADDYYGIYLTDTWNATDALALTASARYNIANIALTDHRGSNLSGSSVYRRLDPAFGAAYKIAPELTAYAGYTEGNRAPTPSEIECSDPAQPCLLPSSLSSDPPKLKQVVSHGYETGLRGSFALPAIVPGKFSWNFALFRTDLEDDIYAVATSLSTGFFENIGSTRRQGAETGLRYEDSSWSIFGAYSFVDAIFRSPLTLPSPNNPFADANGNIHVRPGDRLPGIPQHQLKLGADYRIWPNWTVGATMVYFGPQFLRGDESNQNPQLPGYAVVNLHSSYEVTEHIEIFAAVSNLFDAHYSTFGQFGDPTGVGAPGVPAGAVTNGPGVDNRFVSPAPPIAVYGGIRAKF